MKKMFFLKTTKACENRFNSSKKNTKKLISDPRRGVSIVELVVALAIISIISGSALSIMLSSSKNESKIMREIEVTNQAENAVECFRYVIDASNGESNDESKPYGTSKKKIEGLRSLLNETAGNLYKPVGYSPESNDNSNDSGNDIYVIKLERYAYTITITVDFSNNKLHFESFDRNGKEIYSLNYTYTKG